MRKIDDSDKIYSGTTTEQFEKNETKNCFDKTGMRSKIYLLSIQNIPKKIGQYNGVLNYR